MRHCLSKDFDELEDLRTLHDDAADDDDDADDDDAGGG